MNPPDNLDPLSQRLAAWSPAPVRSGRDRILFEAGVAAGQRQTRRQMAAILIPLLVGSGGWIWHERTERQRVELVLIERSSGPSPTVTRTDGPAPRPIEQSVAAAPFSYVALSQRVQADGLDFPHPVSPTSNPDRSPTRVGVVLTPLSSRRVAELADL